MKAEQTARWVVATVAAIAFLVGDVFAIRNAWSTGFWPDYFLVLVLFWGGLSLTGLAVTYMPWFWTDQGTLVLWKSWSGRKR